MPAKKAKYTDSGKSGVVVLVALLGVLIAGGAGVYMYGNNQKKAIKTLATRQGDSLTKLEEKYAQIVEVYKQSENQSDKEKNMVLGISTQREIQNKTDTPMVLGLEDNPSITENRKLIEMLRGGKNLTRDIKETNDSVNSKLKNIAVALVLRKESPVKATEQFVTNTDRILDYFEKSSDLEIKAVTYGFDLGVALQLAIVNGDEPSVKKLEQKLDDLRQLAREEKDEDVSVLPAELKAAHDSSVSNTDKIVKQFEDIPALIRSRNIIGLRDKLTSIVTDAGVMTQKGTVQIVSFWQNDPTIRSTGDLKHAWEKFGTEL